MNNKISLGEFTQLVKQICKIDLSQSTYRHLYLAYKFGGFELKDLEKEINNIDFLLE
jgi:hypothetical protein